MKVRINLILSFVFRHHGNSLFMPLFENGEYHPLLADRKLLLKNERHKTNPTRRYGLLVLFNGKQTVFSDLVLFNLQTPPRNPLIVASGGV